MGGSIDTQLAPTVNEFNFLEQSPATFNATIDTDKITRAQQNLATWIHGVELLNKVRNVS